MSEDFDKYLAIANHDIQMAKDMGELKSYVASLLYDNDKKVDMIHELEEKNKRLNNIINGLEKWLEVNLTNLEKEKANNTYDKGLKQGMLSNGRLIKNKLQELKGSDKE